MHRSKRNFRGSSEAFILLCFNLTVFLTLKVAFHCNTVSWCGAKQNLFRRKGHPVESGQSHFSHRCFNY